MAFKIETRKGINTIVKWEVYMPRLSTCIKSKSFVVHGCNWNISLESKDCFQTGSGEKWLMTLHNTDNKNPPRLLLTVYIRSIGRDLYQKTIDISSQNIEIWACWSRDFIRIYNLISSTPQLQFVLHFHSGIRNLDTTIKEEKFVQTYDPKYPENHTCMENLSQDLSKLVEDGTDTDVQLKCGDVSIAAHKLILGARSEVFRTMMQSDMMEGREGIVDIIDMEPKLLNIFIRYIYTGNLPDLTVDTALPIYEAADKYQVEALKKRSRQILVENLSPENALVVLVAADAHSDSDLKDQLISYIIQEKIPSKKVEWLKFCKEFPKLAIEVLNYFYDLPSVFQ